MEKISIYFNPEYIDNKPYFMIYIKDFGMWLATEEEYIQILQKPIEPINDIDLYASSRDFIKIAENIDGHIEYFNDFEDKEKLKSLMKDFNDTSLRRSLYNPFFKVSYSKLFGMLKRFINNIE